MLSVRTPLMSRSAMWTMRRSRALIGSNVMTLPSAATREPARHLGELTFITVRHLLGVVVTPLASGRRAMLDAWYRIASNTTLRPGPPSSEPSVDAGIKRPRNEGRPNLVAPQAPNGVTPRTDAPFGTRTASLPNLSPATTYPESACQRQHEDANFVHTNAGGHRPTATLF
jgi:hypothetical protein